MRYVGLVRHMTFQCPSVNDYEKNEGEEGYVAELDIDSDGIINADYYNYILENYDGSYVGDSDFKEYMDKNADGVIDDSDAACFSAAYAAYDWDHAFKRITKVLAGGEFPYSFNLHDTNLDLNGLDRKRSRLYVIYY